MNNEYGFPIGKAWCQEVIICTTQTRGKGTQEDPLRGITQIFSKEGNLIVEIDPEERKKHLK
jgi:hypothetical protein